MSVARSWQALFFALYGFATSAGSRVAVQRQNPENAALSAASHAQGISEVDRRDSGAARLRRVRGRSQSRHLAFPFARDAPAPLSRGRGGGPADRERQGGGAGARAPACPAPLL